MWQEEHVLERRKASSCSILSLFSKREGNSLRNILTFPIYMVSTLSLKEDLSFSHEGPFFLSQRNTEEQNTQRPTETLSQPISQNLTATFSSNALCSLYAEGLLWARNCPQKGSVNSVRSVRDKTPQRERKNSPAICLCDIS